jgi:hypothetical protein
VARIANNKEQEASSKSAKMTTQQSTPTSKLSDGLKNINTNKLSIVRPCLKLYFSLILLLAFLFMARQPELA